MTLAGRAQDALPDKPFRRVHLVNLTADQERKLRSALAHMNETLAKAGYPGVQYPLFKVFGKQQGNYTHLWEANWSGRAEYEDGHKLPVYTEADAQLRDLAS